MRINLLMIFFVAYRSCEDSLHGEMSHQTFGVPYTSIMLFFQRELLLECPPNMATYSTIGVVFVCVGGWMGANNYALAHVHIGLVVWPQIGGRLTSSLLVASSRYSLTSGHGFWHLGPLHT